MRNDWTAYEGNLTGYPGISHGVGRTWWPTSTRRKSAIHLSVCYDAAPAIEGLFVKVNWYEIWSPGLVLPEVSSRHHWYVALGTALNDTNYYDQHVTQCYLDTCMLMRVTAQESGRPAVRLAGSVHVTETRLACITQTSWAGVTSHLVHSHL